MHCQTNKTFTTMGKRIIAIKGDYEKGFEVISLLMSKGAENVLGKLGFNPEKYYYIEQGIIESEWRENMDTNKFEFHNLKTYYNEYGKTEVVSYDLMSAYNQFERAYKALNYFNEKHEKVISTSTLVSMDTIKSNLETKLNELYSRKDLEE